MAHVSVLLQETISGLNLTRGASVLDATFGGGGHSMAIAEAIGRTGELYAIDADRDAFPSQLTAGLKKKCQFHFAIGNFRNLGGILDRMGAGDLDAAVFDLGVSSMQLESRMRGFSFQRDEPLLMTLADMGDHEGVTAETIVNEWEEKTLETIFRGFGEERFAKRIASAIAKARKDRRITTSGQLADIINIAIPQRFRRARIHPATKSFQAIRIAVNEELVVIEEAIPQVIERLRKKGRIGVISFHSLEDRMIKHLFKRYQEERKITLVNKRPIIPTERETATNPRSRSAKLRIAERI